MNSSPINSVSPRRHVTTEQKIAIRTLRDRKYTHDAIATALGLTRRQVHHSCLLKGVTPIARSGRPPALSSCQIDEIEAFVTSSPNSWRMTYMDLSLEQFRNCGVSELVIRSSLLKRGYKRYIARSKPPLTEHRKLKRKERAQAHLNWNRDQWSRILWTDETWVMGGQHTNVWVTRKVGKILLTRYISNSKADPRSVS